MVRSVFVAYLLWCMCAIGCCGAHRFYCGRHITGLIYMFTFGLLGIGQLFDLVLIPGMVASTAAYGPTIHVNIVNSAVANNNDRH